MIDLLKMIVWIAWRHWFQICFVNPYKNYRHHNMLTDLLNLSGLAVNMYDYFCLLGISMNDSDMFFIRKVIVTKHKN